MKKGEKIQIRTLKEILMTTKTEYVRKFVENVDRIHILTAEMNMQKNTPVITYPKDGPRIALRNMKTNALSSIFVVDKQNNFLGIVKAEDALEAVDKEKKQLITI